MRMIKLTVMTMMILFLLSCAFMDYDYMMSQTDTEFDQFIIEKMREAKRPGLSLGVFNKEGVLFSAQYGMANLEAGLPVEENTPSNTGSVIKIVTGIGIMQLAERGMIDIEADVNNYIDFDVRNPAYSSTPITIRMLMTHSAGIAMNFPKIWFTKTEGQFTGDLELFCRDYLVPGGQYYEKQNYADFAPGEGFVYSNVSITLLAHVIERLSGMSLEEYCRKNIFDPLNMDHTSFMFSRLNQPPVAIPYAPGLFDTFIPLGLYSFPIYPAGWAAMSAGDMMILLRILVNDGTLDGVQILTKDSVDRMKQIETHLHPEYVDGQGLVIEFKHLEEGFTIMGHTGGFDGISAMVFYDETIDRGAVMLANGSWQNGMGYDRFKDEAMREILVKLLSYQP